MQESVRFSFPVDAQAFPEEKNCDEFASGESWVFSVAHLDQSSNIVHFTFTFSSSVSYEFIFIFFVCIFTLTLTQTG